MHCSNWQLLFDHLVGAAEAGSALPSSDCECPRTKRWSEFESINVSIGAYVEAVLSRYKRLETTKALQRFASEYRLAGVATESMQPTITVRANYPHLQV
jgi:hypothetical protein